MSAQSMSDIAPDTLTDDELLGAALAAARADPTDQSEGRWSLVRALHRRADRRIFVRVASWCSSPDVVERALGADVLAQLGTGSEAGVRLFALESAPILCVLLRDAEERVIMSALYALGHLDAGDPIDIVSLSTHPSADIRHAVAYALGGRADVLSMHALITLSSDNEEDVRDWATFALGSLCDVDTKEIRETLMARLSDENAEVRGEALVGLAMRADRRVAPYLIAALKSGDTHYLVLEAAEELLTACPDETELQEIFAARR